MARDQQMETERLSPQQDQEQVRQAEVERGQDTEQEREVERAAEMERTQDMAGTILSADQWVRESQPQSDFVMVWTRRYHGDPHPACNREIQYYHMVFHTILAAFE